MELTPSSKVDKPPYLWHCGYWDGPQTGIALFRRERVWFDMCDENFDHFCTWEEAHALKGALYDLHHYIPYGYTNVSVDADGDASVEVILHDTPKIGNARYVVTVEEKQGKYQTHTFCVSMKPGCGIDGNWVRNATPVPVRLDLDALFREIDSKIGELRYNWRRRFTLHRLTPEQLAFEEQIHADFERHVGSHTTYNGEARRSGEVHPRSQHHLFYDKYKEILSVRRTYASNEVLGWYEI